MDYLFLTKEVERSGGSRYYAMDAGCGCCAGPVPLELQKCKDYIVHLTAQLALAREALADMETNGETFPYVPSDEPDPF